MIKSATNNNEKTLVSAIVSGDQRAITRLYKQVKPMVMKYVLKNSGTKEDGEEILQESFMVLYDNLQKKDFKLSCKISTFLYSVARNKWLKRLRRPQVDIGLEYIEIEDEETYSAEKEVRFQKMETALKKLGNPCADILKAFYYLKQSMNDIAREFEYANAQTAKNQKYKCLQRLKKLL